MACHIMRMTMDIESLLPTTDIHLNRLKNRSLGSAILSCMGEA